MNNYLKIAKVYHQAAVLLKEAYQIKKMDLSSEECLPLTYLVGHSCECLLKFKKTCGTNTEVKTHDLIELMNGNLCKDLDENFKMSVIWFSNFHSIPAIPEKKAGPKKRAGKSAHPSRYNDYRFDDNIYDQLKKDLLEKQEKLGLPAEFAICDLNHPKANELNPELKNYCDYLFRSTRMSLDFDEFLLLLETEINKCENAMLNIENLSVNVTGKEILKGFSLNVAPGTVHAIMGPNGSGKSTLSYTLAGREGYQVTGGSATLNGQDLLALEPDERAAAGLFLAFQYPVEIPGVPLNTFLKTALNSIRRKKGQEEVPALDFLRLIKTHAQRLGIPDDMLKRGVNVGASGGEKKRNDILQMSVLQPKLCILDETDSGLDIDALKIVADGVNALRAPDRSFIVITHYQRLLDYIKPDVVHVMAGGRIVKTGGPELAFELEKSGYADWMGAA